MQKVKTIVPGDIPVRDFHQFLLGSVAPRPIAFVSTIDDEGNMNLAPYSFFNAFSSNPPILVFSSNRRVSNNTTKDTLHNVQLNKECVINVVNYDIVHQMAVASVEFPTGISEFSKSGLTPIPSEEVTPARVAESPAQMECKVNEIITLGEHGGAGHLIICEVVKMHISEEVIDDRGRIDPHKMDLMGRMGRAYYVRASGNAIHTIIQEVTQIVVGYDGLPKSIRESEVLNANQLGILAGLKSLPTQSMIDEMKNLPFVIQAMEKGDDFTALHEIASEMIDNGEKMKAAAILMCVF